MNKSERAALKRLLKSKDADSVAQGLALFEAIEPDDQDALAAGIGVDPVLGGLQRGAFAGPLGMAAAMGMVARAHPSSGTAQLADRVLRIEHRVQRRSRGSGHLFAADLARLPRLQRLILVGSGPISGAGAQWASRPAVWLEQLTGDLAWLDGSGVEELVLAEMGDLPSLPETVRSLALLRTPAAEDAIWALPLLGRLHVSYASPALRNAARARGVRLTTGATLTPW